MRASNSSIQCFKSCRRMYELRYIHELEPIYQSDAIERGLSYHDGVEHLLRGWMDANPSEELSIKDPKISAMVGAFRNRIIPVLKARGVSPTDVEQWFQFKTKSGHTIVGRVDGIMSGNTIIEHKTTSGMIDGSYFQRLDLDEQIPTYMLAFNTDRIYYTVCSTPSIRQGQRESSEEFLARCEQWYQDRPDEKITIVELTKTKEELDQFASDLDAIVNEMESCKNFYRNPNNCMKWGRLCEYAPVCMNYDPNMEYVQFRKGR